MEIKRLTALDIGIATTFYNEISTPRELHGIEFCDVSNMDEKDFQLGQIRDEVVLFDKTMRTPVAPSTSLGY